MDRNPLCSPQTKVLMGMKMKLHIEAGTLKTKEMQIFFQIKLEIQLWSKSHVIQSLQDGQRMAT